MDELLMREVGALLEQGEFGAFAWANTLVGSGRTWCVLLYPQSGRAGQRTKKLAETLGSNDQNLWIPGGRAFPEDDRRSHRILIKTSVGALAGRHARAH
ncbi:hypothetical protein IU487_36170, partial [Nocardia puris]|uniref:hypothetical protein n=1 Tax=Nocardia puris TaxID=208602 RepID=UPI001892F2D2